MAVTSAGARADPGKLAMVPLAAVLLALQLTRLAQRPAAGPLAWAGGVLTVGFYGLIMWNYLRRGPAAAASRSVTDSAVALVATFSPAVLPLLHAAPAGVPGQAAADVLLLGGTAVSVWALRCLGPNLSVFPQARGLSDRGPYRVIRHPLYAGEVVSALGLAIAAGTVAGYLAWLALVAMQAYRARAEERVLLTAVPGYLAYRARTAALLPGVF